MPENVLSNNTWLGKCKLKGFGDGRNLIEGISWPFFEKTGENQETPKL
jgi:hypothetical protein